MPDLEKKQHAIQAVDNALTVLEAFGEVDEDLRISTLSETLGLNKSYVFRVLATLEGRGYVEKVEQHGRYRLGLSAYEMGQKFLLRMGLLNKARPIMIRLARECDEAVYLAVRRKQEVLMLDMVDSTQAVSIVPLVGNRYPLSQVAVGKVLHAFRCEPEGTDAPAAAEELERIRQRGVGFDCGGLGENTASLAVPLFNLERELPGGLCIVGPAFRLTEERIEVELLPRLKEAGQALSSQLGFLDTQMV